MIIVVGLKTKQKKQKKAQFFTKKVFIMPKSTAPKSEKIIHPKSRKLTQMVKFKFCFVVF